MHCTETILTIYKLLVSLGHVLYTRLLETHTANPVESRMDEQVLSISVTGIAFLF
jgi:hypothetical protein